MKIKLLALLLFLITSNASAWDLSDLELPDNFQIKEYAKVRSARQLALAPNGVVFVGTSSGKIYALLDKDKDYQAEQKILISDKLKVGAAVAFYEGSLYTSDLNKIMRFPNILANLTKKINPEILTNKLPSSAYHGKRFLKFSPHQKDEKKLFVGIGAPCNVCLRKGTAYATIVAVDLKSWEYEIYASGVRNTVGFDWHPETKELWFTDNGRDWLGDDSPPDELNRSFSSGLHFGFPYLHGDNYRDPEFYNKRQKRDYEKPVQNLGAHVAALGMTFYTGEMFPSDYYQQIFIAEHGSWNRSKKSGYRITQVKLKGNQAISYQPFISGWEINEKVYGRPVDLLVLNDGSLLISDDYAGLIYRVTYNPAK